MDEDERRTAALKLMDDAGFAPTYTNEGYTDEMANALCAHLNRVAFATGLDGGKLAVGWAFHDKYGFGGDSSLYFFRTHRQDGSGLLGCVEVYEVPIPYRDGVENDRFVDALLALRDGQAEPNQTMTAHRFIWSDHAGANFAFRHVVGEAR